MLTLNELRKLDEKSLAKELEEVKKELFKSKFDVSCGHSKNGHLIKNHKKQVARINTLLKTQ